MGRSEEGALEEGFAFSPEVLETMLRRIYRKELDTASEIELNGWREFWRCFNEATDEGVRSFNEGDRDFYRELRHNNGVFAAFRAHRFQNDIAAQLLDADGRLKPFERFAYDVRTLIAPTHLRAWLRTEYATAVIRARQAVEWRRFEANRDVLPNLRWVPSSSLHPGADHKVFWNTVRPIDDPFWGEHRPGDRWNCKCGLEATDEPPTEVPKGGAGDRPSPGLDNNPARDAKLFSDTHPYIQNAYPGARQAVERAMTDQERYTVVNTARGSLRIHERHGRGEREENIRVASYFVEKYGYEIDLLPRDDERPCADAYNWTLGHEEEYKVNTKPTANAIDRAIRSAKRQADYIVLWIDTDMDLDTLSAAIKNRVRREENVRGITVVIGEKDHLYTREDIMGGAFKIRLADLR